MVEPTGVNRKLTVILAADVEGFLDGLRKAGLPEKPRPTAP